MGIFMENTHSYKNRNYKKKKRQQEIIINLVSLIMVIVAVFIIILNISSDDDVKSADTMVNLAEGNKNVESEIGGIPVGDIKATEDTTGSDGVTGNEDVTNGEKLTGSENITDGENITDNENTQGSEDETTGETSVPGVAVKEYNNVASGKLSETKYVSNDYFNNALFLGDSRTVALQANSFIPKKNTFAVNGISHVTYLTQQFTDEVTGVTGDIFSIVRERKPDKIYIALGVNGVAFIGTGTFLKRYEELVDGLMEASPESKIIVQCILPVNEQNYTGGNPNLNNNTIDNMNKELLKLAERKGIFYLDISYILKDENNRLAKAYDSGDGLHFSFTGYSAVYDGICRHGID